MSAGLATHTHDILEAVKTWAPRVVDRLAIICSRKTNKQHTIIKKTLLAKQYY